MGKWGPGTKDERKKEEREGRLFHLSSPEEGCKADGERQRERDRDRQRETETDRDRHRDRDRDREKMRNCGRGLLGPYSDESHGKEAEISEEGHIG